MSARLDHALEDAKTCYLNKRPRCIQSFDDATAFMPGGNTRSVLFHEPVPLRIIRGKDCLITDADGFEYINLLGEYTAGLFGHSHPTIIQAITEALNDGLSLSGHTLHEIELARLVCSRFRSIDLVRFTNSGTEANLLALSAARHFTGRSKIMVFEGGYHGGLLYFRSGSSPVNVPFDYLITPYNEIDTARQMIRANRDTLSCVLVEPMQGASGCIPASPDFMQMLREETAAARIVLIFDEVMTSRLSIGGWQQRHDIIPDMTTLGKYLGGGLSFGAFGGRSDIMQLFDPRHHDSLPHAGTFNNNTLTMAAGIAAMEKVLTAAALEKINEQGDQLRTRLNQVATQYHACIQFTGIGSLLGIHTTRRPITSIKDVRSGNPKVMQLLFLDLLERGYYVAPRGFMALMLSLTQKHLDDFVTDFVRILASRGRVYQ